MGRAGNFCSFIVYVQCEHLKESSPWLLHATFSYSQAHLAGILLFPFFFSLSFTTGSRVLKLSLSTPQANGGHSESLAGRTSAPRDNDLDRSPSVISSKTLKYSDHPEVEPCLRSSLSCAPLALGTVHTSEY